jgi:hypothetical protein
MPDKDRERRYLTALRHCVDGLPPDEAVESERPDFLLGSSLTRIGIEFTEYHHPPSRGERPHQEIQSLQDRVVSLAEDLHHKGGGPALYVSAIFGSHGRLAKESVGPIAKALANAVLSQDVPRSMRDESVEILRDLLPPEIAHVRVHGSVDSEDRLWQAGAGGWVAQIAPSDVQREIARKQRTAGAAHERCDALWLVIVHNIVRGAPCELSEQAKTAEYAHSFNRVFWLDPHSPSALEFHSRLTSGFTRRPSAAGDPLGGLAL